MRITAGRRATLARRLLHDRLALVGALILAAMMAAAIVAPALARHSPTAVSVSARLAGPSRAHPFGTDALGRDIFSRVLYGARWSLGAALAVTVVVAAIGVVVGATCGYLGGPIDSVVMRVVDALLAFPTILLALAIVGAVGPGLRTVLIGLVAVGWAGYARVVRGEVLALREQPFVMAARAAGDRRRDILVHHILANVVSPVVVLASLETGQLILALAGLSFLGLGAQPPTPEWGAMLNDGRVFFLTAPQLMLYPGMAISLVVTALNLLGDGLRDVLDPRTAAAVARCTGGEVAEGIDASLDPPGRRRSRRDAMRPRRAIADVRTPP